MVSLSLPVCLTSLSAFLSACLCTATHSRCCLSGRLVLQRSSSQTIRSPLTVNLSTPSSHHVVLLFAFSTWLSPLLLHPINMTVQMWSLVCRSCEIYPSSLMLLSVYNLKSAVSFHPSILTRHPKANIFTLFYPPPPLSWALSLQLHSPDVVTGVVLQFSKIQNSTHATLVTERKALFWHRRFIGRVNMHIVFSCTNSRKMAYRAFLLPPL